jgi:RHS repeat-associated protein
LNGTSYTWDANGNLLNDGESDYTYDSANRLVAVTKGETISQYTYNGLGDRIQQIVNGVTTDYVLDINTGLTQVLQDGTNTYLYGINRVAQSTAEQSKFFLADALGSVRNLTDSAGIVTLTQSYTPFGEILESFGEDSTDYAFTGEMFDPNTGLVFLRARYYQPSVGRFTSRDVWDGNNQMPMSYNSWLYVNGNPIRYTDPQGLWLCELYDPACAENQNELKEFNEMFNSQNQFTISQRKIKYQGTFYRTKTIGRIDKSAAFDYYSDYLNDPSCYCINGLTCAIIYGAEATDFILRLLPEKQSPNADDLNFSTKWCKIRRMSHSESGACRTVFSWEKCL